MTHPATDPPSLLDPHELVAIFHRPCETFGRFTRITEPALPQESQQLLAHGHHMTVAMERYHQGPVQVAAVAVAQTPAWYARESLLRREDGRVVQIGIVRLRWNGFPPELREPMESAQIPLGRLLVQQNTLRTVTVETLFRVDPSPRVAELVGVAPSTSLFGRTARIQVHGEPIIDLLEIAVPVTAASPPHRPS